jgi:hypothetical protein
MHIRANTCPVWNDDLSDPERFTNPVLIQNIVADGITLGR